MKKLLIFMLVFGMASVASAVLTEYQGYYFKMGVTTPTVIYIGDTVSVEILAGTNVGGVSEMIETVLNVSEAATISAITVSIPGDWSASFVSTSASGDGFNANVEGILPLPISAGDSIYSFSFTTLQEGTVTIDAVSGQWHGFTAEPGDGTQGEAYSDFGPPYGLPYAQITVIPEPMTVLLLGLGGLFLRRRK